ncbi:thioesterase II family protein [Paenibacillus monticola]|uniref:Thioesterase n=1 Tax=Paenibacillus monticola TaxID=2666075 RepID=A0A7X2HBQ4_9BACL|nr:thioesterase domain-containing protein [Paenibacillus monticola]MRN57178.1 thioesterase [Paenibacillus monticola]
MIKLKLFCIPHAGGLACYFNEWKLKMKERSDIEVCPLELAGKGSRSDEPMYNSIEDASIDIYNILRASHLDDCPYAILGHSMGAIILLEVLHQIHYRRQIQLPVHVFFSGEGAPKYTVLDPMSELPLEIFINRIKNMGGIPEELSKYPDFLAEYISIIQNDYKLIDKYDHKKEYCFENTKVSVMNGNLDTSINPLNKSGWQDYFTSQINIKDFNGGHFFIKEDNDKVVSYIVNTLNSGIEMEMGIVQ